MNESMILSVTDAAKTLNVSRATLYRILSSGALKAKKIGARTGIERAAIQSYIESLPAYQTGADEA